MMKTKVIILTVLTFLLSNGLSFAEKEQKDIREETSVGWEESCVRELKFSLRILSQTLELINAEKSTHLSVELLDTVCCQMIYLIIEGIQIEDMFCPTFPYKDEFVMNRWREIKKYWDEIKNNDYYKSAELKKTVEWHDTNMGGFFETWFAPSLEERLKKFEEQNRPNKD